MDRSDFVYFGIFSGVMLIGVILLFGSMGNGSSKPVEEASKIFVEMGKDMDLRREMRTKDISTYLGKEVEHKFVTVDDRYVVEDKEGFFYSVLYKDNQVVNVTEITSDQFAEQRILRAEYDKKIGFPYSSRSSTITPVPIIIPR